MPAALHAALQTAIPATAAQALASAAQAGDAAPAVHLEGMPHKAVSELKREGWRGLMRSVGSAGQVVMTNHARPEAVVLSMSAYRRLAEQASRAAREDALALENLSRAFDEELAALRQADAGARLRQAFNKPLRMKGKLSAGRGF